jgi:hypothetical protein
MGQRQSGAQGADVAIHNPCHGTQLLKGQVSLAALNAADVTPVNVGYKRKVFLRKPFCFSRRPYPVAEHLKRSLFQPLKAPGKGDYPSTGYSPHFGLLCALSLLLGMKNRRWEPQWSLNTLICALFGDTPYQN